MGGRAGAVTDLRNRRAYDECQQHGFQKWYMGSDIH